VEDFPGESADGVAGRSSACWTSAGLSRARLRATAAGSVEAEVVGEAGEVELVEDVAAVDGAADFF
jgi:hypothetical protein